MSLLPDVSHAKDQVMRMAYVQVWVANNRRRRGDGESDSMSAEVFLLDDGDSLSLTTPGKVASGVGSSHPPLPPKEYSLPKESPSKTGEPQRATVGAGHQERKC